MTDLWYFRVFSPFISSCAPETAHYRMISLDTIEYEPPITKRLTFNIHLFVLTLKNKLLSSTTVEFFWHLLK